MMFERSPGKSSWSDWRHLHSDESRGPGVSGETPLDFKKCLNYNLFHAYKTQTINNCTKLEFSILKTSIRKYLH